jgi:membrane associated rhomboid family serine protease
MSSAAQVYGSSPEPRPPLFMKKRNFPFATLTIIFTVWGFFIYGLSAIDYQTSKMSWSKPLSPSSRDFWFISVSHYPDCSDLRLEAWRLVSMQVVHSGFAHIGMSSIDCHELMPHRTKCRWQQHWLADIRHRS